MNILFTQVHESVGDRGRSGVPPEGDPSGGAGLYPGAPVLRRRPWARRLREKARQQQRRQRDRRVYLRRPQYREGAGEHGHDGDADIRGAPTVAGAGFAQRGHVSRAKEGG